MFEIDDAAHGCYTWGEEPTGTVKSCRQNTSIKKMTRYDKAKSYDEAVKDGRAYPRPTREQVVIILVMFSPLIIWIICNIIQVVRFLGVL